MKITRLIAVGIMLSSLGISVLQAQSLRKSAPPAEFPPASYKAKQYVDSRGCIYIRAGIDGNVTWIPRVARNRKQVCGFKPTGVAGATSGPQPSTAARKPVIITATPTPAPVPAPKVVAKPRPAPTKPVIAAVKPAKVVRVKPAPKPLVQVKPRPVPAALVAKPAKTVLAKPTRTPRISRATRPKPSPAPAPSVFSAAKPAPVAATPTARVRKPLFNIFRKRQRKPVAPPLKAPTSVVVVQAAPAPKPVLVVAPLSQPRSTRKAHSCSNASEFSQLFINDLGGRHKVRCGPQTQLPYTLKGGGRRESSAAPSNAARISRQRVVRRHIFEKRQNTTGLTVPNGYRVAWDDNRLNPRRAERTFQPAQIATAVRVPTGFRQVKHSDGRLNPNRGVRTAQGQAQTSRIWSNTVPRKLIRVTTQRRIVKAPMGSVQPQVSQNTVTRLSTRSAPVGQVGTVVKSKRLYIRVAVYATDGDARTVAKSLARKGLPMHLGRAKSSGNKVVLAGPFGTDGAADAALGTIRQAGFVRAKINR